MTHCAQENQSPRRLLLSSNSFFEQLDEEGVEAVAAVCASLVCREFDSAQQLVPLPKVFLFLRTSLDRLRLLTSEALIPASFGTVQVSSTTPGLPLRQYPAATGLVPDFGLGRASWFRFRTNLARR